MDGRAPQAGEIFSNPGLARTLRRIIEGGKDAFYQGEIADAIVSVVQQAGGCLSLEDLATHTSTWEQPISTTYRHVRVWECPPNGQGLAALIALNLLEGYDIGSMPPLSTQRLHLMIEAMRLAFADTRWYVADPAFKLAPLEWLLSKDYARQRRMLIHPDRATLDQAHGTPSRLFRHGLPQCGGWKRKCLLLYQQQLHGLWNRYCSTWMGLQPTKSRLRLLTGPFPPQCP